MSKLTDVIHVLIVKPSDTASRGVCTWPIGGEDHNRLCKAKYTIVIAQ